MRKKTILSAALALTLSLTATTAFADKIKIAYLDPLSGPFANIGDNFYEQLRHSADVLVNEKGGVLGGDTFEIVPYDNKLSPKESLIQLQVAIDDGIRIIINGSSSAVAGALTEAIRKHNKRNPEARVLFLNHSALDPTLTNEKCNFYHFRFDANTDMKIDVLTSAIAADENMKKVYVIGQDYSMGKSVAKATVRDLARKRPDIEIVGNELHPIGRVKDFTPYARKIMASGADAIVTPNFGSDMRGLGKSLLEAGFDGPIYTFYGYADGVTAAFGELGKDKLHTILGGPLNPPATDEAIDLVKSFKAKHPDKDFFASRTTGVVTMLAKAIDKAGTSSDVDKIAFALEGMEHMNVWGGKLVMRAKDHQILEDLFVQVHTDENVTFDFDNSGYGVIAKTKVEMAGAEIPTTCDMQRPS